MKIAIVHDYIKEVGGVEQVVRVIANMYPEAPIYTAFVDRSSAAAQLFGDRKIIESSWGWLLKIGKLYSYLRFCLPWVWKSLDLSEYDLIITSCSGYIARGFQVNKQTKVIAYCHTPPRWLYGYDTPTSAQNAWWGKAYMWVVGPFVRYFDYMSAARVDTWIANSNEVKKRIAKFYRKDALVVYPPCEVSGGQSSYAKATDGKKYWLVMSRIVGGKGLEIAVEAAKMAKEKLVIVGTGEASLITRLKDLGGEYVELRGWVDDREMGEVYSGAKGFLALARDEDFGMSVVESISAGVPVLAYNGGGYKETVQDGINGQFVDSLDSRKIAKMMKEWNLPAPRLRRARWDDKIIKQSVKKFGRARFEKEIHTIVGL